MKLQCINNSTLKNTQTANIQPTNATKPAVVPKDHSKQIMTGAAILSAVVIAGLAIKSQKAHKMKEISENIIDNTILENRAPKIRKIKKDYIIDRVYKKHRKEIFNKGSRIKNEQIKRQDEDELFNQLLINEEINRHPVLSENARLRKNKQTDDDLMAYLGSAITEESYLPSREPRRFQGINKVRSNDDC